MHKGAVVLVPFPFTDLQGQKLRPALILHVSRGEDCIVAFITSKKGKLGMYECAIVPNEQNGLRIASVVRLDKLATVEKKVVIGELGVLSSVDMKKVDSVTKKVFGLSA